MLCPANSELDYVYYVYYLDNSYFDLWFLDLSNEHFYCRKIYRNLTHLNWEKSKYPPQYWSDFRGPIEYGVAIFALKVTWNCAYIPFKIVWKWLIKKSGVVNINFTLPTGHQTLTVGSLVIIIWKSKFENEKSTFWL